MKIFEILVSKRSGQSGRRGSSARVAVEIWGNSARLSSGSSESEAWPKWPILAENRPRRRDTEPSARAPRGARRCLGLVVDLRNSAAEDRRSSAGYLPLCPRPFGLGQKAQIPLSSAAKAADGLAN